MNLLDTMTKSLTKTLTFRATLYGSNEKAIAWAKINCCAGRKVWEIVLKRLGW